MRSAAAFCFSVEVLFKDMLVVFRGESSRSLTLPQDDGGKSWTARYLNLIFYKDNYFSAVGDSTVGSIRPHIGRILPTSE